MSKPLDLTHQILRHMVRNHNRRGGSLKRWESEIEYSAIQIMTDLAVESVVNQLKDRPGFIDHEEVDHMYARAWYEFLDPYTVCLASYSGPYVPRTSITSTARDILMRIATGLSMTVEQTGLLLERHGLEL